MKKLANLTLVLLIAIMASLCNGCKGHNTKVLVHKNDGVNPVPTDTSKGKKKVPVVHH